MRYSSVQYATALYELTDESAPVKRRETVKAFFDTLAKNGALPLLPEIEREFGRIISAKEKTRDVAVSAPERLPESAVARKLPFRARVKSLRDIRLLGGAVVEVDGLRVDNSVAMRLHRIREAFTR